MNQSTSASSNSKTMTSVPADHYVVDVKWEKVSYLWTIKHFERFHCKMSKIMESSVFGASAYPEYKWFLRLFIKNDHFGLYLTRDKSPAKINVLVDAKFSLLDSRRNEVHVRRTAHLLEPKEDDWGFSNYISKEKLLDPNADNDLLLKDTLTIFCEVEFAVANSVTTKTEQWHGVQSTIPNSNLSKSLEHLLLSQDLVDVTFSVNGKNFGAHRSIIAARSAVFKAMFKHDTLENRLNEVNIIDMNPEVFEEMLRYMYTDKISDPAVARDLLVAAEKYNVDGLKLLCEEILSKNVSVENSIDVLVLADLHHAEQLKKQVISFIKMRSVEIVSTESWRDTILAHPHLFEDVYGPFVSPDLPLPDNPSNGEASM